LSKKQQDKPSFTKIIHHKCKRIDPREVAHYFFHQYPKETITREQEIEISQRGHKFQLGVFSQWESYDENEI
jgi:hypothetical protein